MAIESGLISSEGLTPERTMATDLTQDIKKNGTNSRFVRFEPGWFSLNRNNSIMDTNNIPLYTTEKLHKRPNSNFEKVGSNGNLYVGKAGEYAVASELFFRNYNVSMMGVDEGIDLVASREGRTFHIQVKTSTWKPPNDYIADIRKSSFERYSSSDTFYVFVLRNRDLINDFLVVTYHRMKEFIDKEVVHEINSNTKYRFAIKIRDSSIYIGNKENDVSYFLNNWKIIT